MSSVSSDDDTPLAKSNGQVSNTKTSVAPGLSIRNGPITDGPMDVDAANGTKRKARSSIGTAVNYKDGSDSDDAPLAKRQKQTKKADSDSDDEPISKKRNGKLPPSYKETYKESALLEDSDDDRPLAVKLTEQKGDIEKAAAKEATALRAKAKKEKATPKKAIKDESDDEPVARLKKRTSNGAAVGSAKKKANGVKKEEEADSGSDSDAPIAKKAKKAAPAAKPKPKAKPKAATPAKKAATSKKASVTPAKSEEPDEDDEKEAEDKWWEDMSPEDEDDSIKWKTLEHNGIMMAEPYVPLPKHVKLLYDGKPVDLHVEAEELAWYFGSMLDSTLNVGNPVFQKNFFRDFKELVEKTGGAKDQKGNKVEIKEFAKLDFSQMWDYHQDQKLANKNKSSAEKKAEKAKRDEREGPYMYCLWNGRKERVASIRVEPPGLFRGRGQHPKTGTYKRRVYPEQITINIGKEAKVPEPPAGHKWKEIRHDQTCSWLAMWHENVNGAPKYIHLANNSLVKQKADMKKFERARELKKHIDRIREDYGRDLKSKVMADRQRATAMYLIDKFALRAGNEKDAETEAETVGCCSLKYENVIVGEEVKEGDKTIGGKITLDFNGKDSIPFHQEVVVDIQVWKNFIKFKQDPKRKGDDIFDRLNPTQLNKHLGSYMTRLSAKVFRTYNASWTMSQLFKKLDPKAMAKKTPQEKMAEYNACNREVAILCNHKRTVGAAHAAQMVKMEEKIKGLRYQKWRTKMMMLDVDPKIKKKKGADFFALDKDLDEEWVKKHQAFLVEEERKKITKKFEKENEKRVENKEKPLPEKELKERLKPANELEAKFKKENKTKKVEAEGKAPSITKLEAAISKLDKRIGDETAKSADREDNKEIALGTSKLNYIDPRLTVVFCKKFDLAIEKVFPKTMREKFKWAIEQVGDDTTWEF